MRIPAILLLASTPILSFTACSIYDSSLLGSGGSASTSTSSGAGGDMSTSTGGAASTSTSTSTGGAKPCTKVTDCPGPDSSECGTRTCKGGMCGLDLAADGTPLAAQTANDCFEAVCDGAGATKSIPKDADAPDDGKECTDDTCGPGGPIFTARAVGAGCGAGGLLKCTADSLCVECIVDDDCPSKVCDPQSNKCAPAGCGDAVKNGLETDTDCGGTTCPNCATGKVCAVGTDCVGGTCTGNVCAPTCTDGLKNNSETDIDCGGPGCTKCGVGSACGGSADCLTGNCTGSLCYQNHLVINEIDYDQISTDTKEFVEIYNGTGSSVALTNLALVFINGSDGSTYNTVALGPGTLPAGGYLVVGAAAVTVAAPSVKILNSMAIQNGPDGVALVDTTAGQSALIDALSYKGPITMANIAGLGVVSLVEGTLLVTGDSTAKEGSLSRLPNGSDTNNAASDWAFSDTPTPGAANVP